MKGLLVSFIIILNMFSIKAQHIDSVVVVNASLPPTLHIYTSLPHDGFEFLRFESQLNADDFILDLYFDGCIGNFIIDYFDTLFVPTSSSQMAPNTILVRTIKDTNTINSNCGNQTDTIIVDEYLWGINSLKFVDSISPIINVYPNPSHSFFSINNGKGNVKSIKLYNTEGVLVKLFGFNQMFYNIQNLPKGIYFLEININNIIVNKKLLIMR